MSQTCPNKVQKSGVDQPSPKLFNAEQLRVDDNLAPVLPPDFIEKIHFTSVEEARQKYKDLRFKHRRRRNRYVPGALYKNLFPDNFVILDHGKEGDFDISIDLPPLNTTGTRKRKNGEDEPLRSATTLVRVRSAVADNAYLSALLTVDCQLKASKGCVRQGRGEVGKMWQVGVKNRGLMTHNKKHYKATESAFLFIDKTILAGSPFIRWMNCMMTEYFRSAFPSEYQKIQECNKGVEVDGRIGGDGSLHTFSISRDLGNAAHVDSRDESVSLCTWIEEKPGTAKNWFFILPNTSLVGDPSKAVVIKLAHGLSISWDGKILDHCTSVTETGVKNHVYGNFTSACKARTLG